MKQILRETWNCFLTIAVWKFLASNSPHVKRHEHAWISWIPLTQRNKLSSINRKNDLCASWYREKERTWLSRLSKESSHFSVVSFKGFLHFPQTSSFLLKSFCCSSIFPYFHIHQLKIPHTIHDKIKTGKSDERGGGINIFPVHGWKVFFLVLLFEWRKMRKNSFNKITVKHDYSYVENWGCLMHQKQRRDLTL